MNKKKIMKKIIFFFAFPLLFGCATQKPQKLTNRFHEISFGHFGGFTGIKTEYSIDNRGCITKTGIDTVLLVKTLERRNLSEIYEAIKESGFDTLEVYHPGNITRFIRLKKKNFSKTLFWTDELDVPQLTKLNQILFEQLKSAK